MVGNDLKHLCFWTVTKPLYKKIYIWCLVSTNQHLSARRSFSGRCYCNKGDKNQMRQEENSSDFLKAFNVCYFLLTIFNQNVFCVMRGF